MSTSSNVASLCVIGAPFRDGFAGSLRLFSSTLMDLPGLYETLGRAARTGALSGGEFLDAESGTHARGFLDPELLVADGSAAIIRI
jgi:hypothetical protein